MRMGNMSGRRNLQDPDAEMAPGRSRTNHTLETKLEVLRRFERGDNRKQISEALGLPGSSVYYMQMQTERIKELAKMSGTPLPLPYPCSASKTKDVAVVTPKAKPRTVPITIKAVKINGHYTPETKNEVVRLRKKGKSVRDISQAMSIPLSTIFEMVKLSKMKTEAAKKRKAAAVQKAARHVMQARKADMGAFMKVNYKDIFVGTQKKAVKVHAAPSLTKEKTRKRRRPHSLATTVEVVKRLQRGEKGHDIAQTMGLPKSTVWGMMDRTKKIKSQAMRAGLWDEPVSEVTSGSPGCKDIVMENMEVLLKIFIDEHLSKPGTLTDEAIQRKALTLWKFIWDSLGPEETKGVDKNFNASEAWLRQFKKDIAFSSKTLAEAQPEPRPIPSPLSHKTTVKITPRSAPSPLSHKTTVKIAPRSAPSPLSHKANIKVVSPMQRGTGVPKGFSSLLRAKIEVGGYTARQVINLDEMGLYWKKFPANTIISAGEEKGSQEAMNPLSLMLGANATGDLKLKPLLVYPTESPACLSGYIKEYLPVIWRSHPRGRVVSALCQNYVVDYISQRCKEYALEHNLQNRFLLLVDNGAAYPPSMDDWADNIEVMFMPTMSQAVVQPMDHGITAAFRRCYLHRLMDHLLRNTDVDDKEKLREFLRDYNIKHAVNNIKMAWDDIAASTVNAAWQSIWPECVRDSYGCSSLGEPTEQDIVGLAHQAGFSQVTLENIHELLKSSGEELSSEDLLQIELDQASLEHEKESPMEDAKTLDVNLLHHVLSLFDEAMAVLEDNDPNCTRSCDARNFVERGIRGYRELHATKKRKQNTSIL